MAEKMRGIFIIGVLPFLVGGCLFRPPSVTDIDVKGVPADCGQLVIGVEANGKFMPMNYANDMVTWYGTKPIEYDFGGQTKNDTTSYWTRVFWTQGEKAGVVMRNSTKGWKVYWFLSTKIRRDGEWLLGGGTWRCDLQDADEVRQLSANEAEQLNSPQ